MASKVSNKLERKCDTFEQALGAAITELRIKQGWRYQHVARRAGCSEEYMNGIELGQRNPTMDLLARIADLHGLKLAQLLALGERKYKRGRKKK
jgi:transcriptional regulator with XRE-family HTH domain